MTYVDFAALKEAVSIEQVASILDLQFKASNKQLRGRCPVCGGSERGLVITPDKGVYYCFADQNGGDLIALAAHVRSESMKEAAAFITGSLTVPEERVAKETRSNQKLQPLAHLEYDHPAIVALGLDPAVAESLGIGYAPKGVARGNVVIPVREADGTLRGYLGVQELTFIPKDFETLDNVVPLKREKA
jgi:DNA primase